MNPATSRYENLAFFRFPLVAMVLVRAKDLRHPRQGFAPRRGALDTLELLFQADREIGVVILPVAPDRALQFGVACLEAPRRRARRHRLGLAPLWSEERCRDVRRVGWGKGVSVR